MDEIDQSKIDAFNEQQAISAEERAKIEDTALALNEILKSQKGIENSVRESILSLVKFIQKHKPEVSVNNQKDYPKYDEVVSAVKEVVAEVKNSNKALKTVESKEADYSPITSSLEKLSSLVAKLPTTIPIPKSVEVSNQKDYSGKFDEVTQAVGRIPAPIVNVEKPVIPDNSKELDKIVKAVEKIKFPDIPKTDLDPLLKATKKISDTINNLSFPVPNYILPFKDSTGKAVQAQVDQYGNLPTTTTPQAMKTTISGAITYLANAAAGSAQSSAVWRAMKIDETTGSVITWADGNTAYDNIATDLSILTYS